VPDGPLLAIDLGTSSAKVGLVAPDGQLLGFARRTYPLARGPEPGRAEQDPEQWWAAVLDGIHELGTVAAGHLRSVQAVCVGGQGPTLVLVDAEGQPVRPALSWMDTRASAHAERLTAQLGSDRAAYSLVPRLVWAAEQEPALFERVRWALQAWDFIGLRLAGGRAAAASTFAGDAVWRRDWLAAAGLSESPMIPPEVDAGVPYATTGGRWSAAAGLPEGIPIVGGMNDGVGSIVGAAGSVIGRATDPGGAAGGLAVCWDQRVVAPGIDCWPGLVPDTFIIGGAFVAGGRAVDWWAAATENDLLRTLDLARQAPAGAGGLLFLPFLAGERSPIWDPTARGAFLGLTFEHAPRHLARAVVESTGYELRLLAETVLQAGPRIDELRVCGGQARSQLWNPIKADVIGLPASVPRLPEVALMGNAICAALGAGLYPDLATAGDAMVQVAQVLEPRAEHRAVYDELFGLYAAGYTALKPFFAPLAKAAR
jgi:sugar (pentulose or hexulose) kinase